MTNSKLHNAHLKTSYDLNVRPNGLCYLLPSSVNQKRKKPTKGEKLHHEIIKHDNGQTTVKKTYENGVQVQEWNGLKVEIHGNKVSKILKTNNLKNRGYVLNQRAKAKIQNAITYAYDKTAENISKRLRFFTFTIPVDNYKKRLAAFETMETDQHPDQFYIKKFGAMLDLEQRRYKKIDSYVWTAEKTKAGVIHFHAIFITSHRNQYARDLSDTWGNYCGFVASNCVHYGYKRYNSTEAMQTNNFDNGISPESISNYLTKYVSKNQSTIYGRGYGMSKDFTHLQRESTRKIYGATFTTVETVNLANEPIIKNFIEIGKKKPMQIVDTETGEILSANIRDYDQEADLIPAKHLNTIEMNNGFKIFVFKIDRPVLLKNFYPELYRINKTKIRNRSFIQAKNTKFQSKKKAAATK